MQYEVICCNMKKIINSFLITPGRVIRAYYLQEEGESKIKDGYKLHSSRLICHYVVYHSSRFMLSKRCN